MDKDFFSVFMKTIGIKFSNIEEKLFSCPSCGAEHKWGKCGEYCKMTCYYMENGP